MDEIPVTVCNLVPEELDLVPDLGYVRGEFVPDIFFVPGLAPFWAKIYFFGKIKSLFDKLPFPKLS